MTQRLVSITDFSALDTGPGGIANSYLKDGTHTIVRCHNCRIGLCDVWITQPNLKINSKIKAVCHKCGATSLEVRVKGKFHLGVTEHSNIIDTKYEFSDGKDDFINQSLIVVTKGK